MQDDKGMATFEYFIHLRYQSVFFWAAILIEDYAWDSGIESILYIVKLSFNITIIRFVQLWELRRH